jgi:hypothetical protein
MNFSPTPFDVAFPVGLGALFGMMRYLRMQKTGESDALRKAVLDGLKGVAGAGLIIIAYKSLGIL